MKVRKWLAFVIMLFAMLTCISFVSNAAYKVYDINNANFTVDLKESGDAEVTEVWELTFKSGDFSYFSKDIHCNKGDLKSLEDISDVEFISASINGVECKESYSKDDYTYSTSSDGSNITINWYKKAANEKVVYTVKYIIHDVVKQYKGEALFSYRYVGYNFSHAIDNTYVEIHMPNDSPRTIRNYFIDSQQVDNASIVTFTTGESEGLLKYTIATLLDGFGNLRELSKKPNNKNKDSSSMKDTIVFALVIFGFLVLRFAFYLGPIKAVLFVIEAFINFAIMILIFLLKIPVKIAHILMIPAYKHKLYREAHEIEEFSGMAEKQFLKEEFDIDNILQYIQYGDCELRLLNEQYKIFKKKYPNLTLKRYRESSKFYELQSDVQRELDRRIILNFEWWDPLDIDKSGLYTYLKETDSRSHSRYSDNDNHSGGGHSCSSCSSCSGCGGGGAG